MLSDHMSDSDSPITTRLPSLMALRCFEAAARHESFSVAAHDLSLTPGAISRAVRLLEDELGVALFERRSRRVFLTEAGRQLQQGVSAGFSVMQRSVAQIKAQAKRPRRWVLSCEPTLLMRWLIPRWPAFQAAHPELDIQLLAGGGTFSFDQGIDLAIRRDDFPWPAGCHAETLFAERIGPVCRPDKVAHWFVTAQQGLRLSAQAPRLQTRTRPQAWQHWQHAAGEVLQPCAEQIFEHFYFSLQAAVAGLGVAMGPWNLVRDDLASGLLTAPLGFVEDGSRYCLFSAQPIIAETPAHAILQWLRQQAQ